MQEGAPADALLEGWQSAPPRGYTAVTAACGGGGGGTHGAALRQALLLAMQDAYRQVRPRLLTLLRPAEDWPSVFWPGLKRVQPALGPSIMDQLLGFVTQMLGIVTELAALFTTQQGCSSGKHGRAAVRDQV